MEILVIGGTGNVGRRIVRDLGELGHRSRVLTRNPGSGAELEGTVEYVEGSLDDADNLVTAMSGVDAIYLLTPLHPDEADLGRNALTAAEGAGVNRIVFQSVHHAESASHIPHFGTKAEIASELRAGNFDWTIIEPNAFFQNDFAYQVPISQHGVYPNPLGPVGVSHVDCDDIAAAAVTCLTDGAHSGHTYVAAGPVAHTGEQCAAIWSEVLGRDVRYGGDDVEAWGEQAAASGLPAWLVDDLKIMYRHFIEHGLVATEAEVTAFRGLLGRDPASYEAWASKIAIHWGDL